MQNRGHHSENRYSDKQNKSRWCMQNRGHHSGNGNGGKQNKSRWCKSCTSNGDKNIGDVYS